MLSSLDGKISTGDNDLMDVDKDFPMIKGVSEGLQQYYDIEMTTDLFSLNSGRVFAKIGFNNKTDIPKKLPVTFIVIDNKPHLDENGINYLSQKSKDIILVTTNKDHPAYSVQKNLNNLHIIYFENEIPFEELFEKLKNEYSVEKLTIQSGGSLNAEFIRKGLIDYISLVIAPVMVGGKNTSTLMDGESLHSDNELLKIKALELLEINKLNNSYLHLKYKVIN